jgi:DNA-directed RNA polymerase subunit RPC12/RpoP
MEPDVTMKRIVLDRMERCSVCHRHFSTDDVHIINRQPDMWTMLVECTDCHSRNFVAALMNDGDPGEARLALRRLSDTVVREISPDPAEELDPADTLPAGDPIDAADVVDMHSFLGDFDGDFKQLFGG